jgi:hypothetical protein
LDLLCNNVAECGNTYPALSSATRTDDSARVHGWRVWRSAGLNLILCPVCIGYRARRDKAPERLEGEQPLF